MLLLCTWTFRNLSITLDLAWFMHKMPEPHCFFLCFLTLSLCLFLPVLFPCELIISLAVRQKQTLLTSTCDGSAVAQHGVLAVTFYFFIVLLWLRQEPVAHNRHGGSACLGKYSGGKEQIVRLSAGRRRASMRESVCSLSQVEFRKLSIGFHLQMETSGAAARCA